MEKIRQLVKLNVFDSVLKEREHIETFLKTRQPGTAHTHNGQLLVWDGFKIHQIDIGGLSHDLFLSKVSLGSVEGKIDEYLNKYSQLAKVKDYTVQFLSPGDIVKVTNDPEGLSSFVVTQKKDSYFDYIAYIAPPDLSSISVATYSQRSVSGFTHSGDIGSLLHTLSITRIAPGSSTFVLGAVGFRNTPLHKFSEQLPVVFLVKHETRTIYMVPCPLDKATIGEATLSGLVVGYKKEQEVTYVVLPAPLTVNNVNTGDLSTPTQKAVREAIKQGDVILAAKGKESMVTGSATREEVSVGSVREGSIGSTPSVAPKVIQFIEDGLAPASYILPGDLFVGFGRGLSFNSSFQKATNASIVNIPCLFGPCEGVSALSLSLQPQGDLHFKNLEEWQYVLGQSKVIIVHSSPNWLDTVVSSCMNIANAIFVIHSGLKLEDCSNLDKKALEEKLNNVGSNSLVMAAPNSIVLIELGGNLYFYRGVRWTGLLDTVPNFGDKMTEWFQTIPAWVKSSSKTDWPVISPKNQPPLCFWRGQMLSITQIISTISTMDLESIGKYEEDIVDCLTQLSVLLDPEQISSAVPQIDAVLMGLVNKELDNKKNELKELVIGHSQKELPEGTPEFEAEEEAFNKKLVELRRVIKRLSKNATQKFQKISHVLANLVSVRGSSSRNQDIKRRMRKAAIGSNVQKAQNMSTTEKCDIISKYCVKFGAMMCHLDSTVLLSALQEVGKSTFLTWVKNEPSAGSLASVSTQKTLDGFTIGLLLAENPNNVLKGSDSCIALTLSKKAALPLCLCDEHIALKDPSQVNWPEEANKEMVAMFRIMTRGTLSGALQTRQFNIASSSKELGLLIFHMILCTMESFTKNVTGLPQPEDRNTVTCQIMRGLFGQLLTLLGSGASPLSTLFQFVSRKPSLKIPEPEEWPLFIRMLKMFPYTGWSMRYLLDNVKTFIVRYIRRALIDPVIQPLRVEAKAAKKEDSKSGVSQKNEELIWLCVATQTILRLINNNELIFYESPKEIPTSAKASLAPNSLAIIQKVIESAPTPKPRKGRLHEGSFLTLLDYFKYIAKGSGCGISKHILLTCLNTISKRSAMFGSIKQTLLEDLVDSKMEKYEGDMKEFEKLCMELSKGKIQFHVQNKKALEEKNVNGLKSDAEVKRMPWCVGKEDQMGKINERMLYVLGEGVQVEKKEVSKKEVVPVKPPSHPLVKNFEEMQNNGKVLELANAIINGSFPKNLQHKIPLSEFHWFVEFCGICDTVDDSAVLISKICQRFLEEWKTDGVIVEEAVKKEYFRVNTTKPQLVRKLLQVEEEDSDTDFAYFQDTTAPKNQEDDEDEGDSFGDFFN
uniref:Uncharacterized protein n=1 Tax=Arcella intermedia TaxID=1963864 RepID=A0A6B2KWR1_9EUKA|eukprot:TRINITY_DN7529_c0_g1_i1.p1 TRINITY_DN7529_c0_g1~~TRINITY_DN7529_c0_g1_i1.p1  ORF type:complete len:1343 (+),score=384.39 TRINITY_DN7529_c0_g1_i1:24-4031(+)